MSWPCRGWDSDGADRDRSRGAPATSPNHYSVAFDGETIENPGFESGHVECWDAEAHLPTNTGDEALELILVELKGRAAWGGARAGG